MGNIFSRIIQRSRSASLCLFACLSVCLFVCLFVCLSVCLSVYLSVCLTACLATCQFPSYAQTIYLPPLEMVLTDCPWSSRLLDIRQDNCCLLRSTPVQLVSHVTVNTQYYIIFWGIYLVRILWCQRWNYFALWSLKSWYRYSILFVTRLLNIA